MLLNPPPTTLATPPEAVCESRLVKALPPDELDVLLLEGFPNCMLVNFSSDPMGSVFKPIEEALMVDAVELLLLDKTSGSMNFEKSRFVELLRVN